MPVFVQWKWEDNSFLAIFHFIDDKSKTNLRYRQNKIDTSCPKGILWTLVEHGTEERARYYFSEEFDSLPSTSIMTWAPTHVELGLLTELLTYANIINGFKPSIKDSLRQKLELVLKSPKDTYALPKFCEDIFPNNLSMKTKFIGFQHDSIICGVELCLEYTDYLKEVIRPYRR